MSRFDVTEIETLTASVQREAQVAGSTIPEMSARLASALLLQHGEAFIVRCQGAIDALLVRIMLPSANWSHCFNSKLQPLGSTQDGVQAGAQVTAPTLLEERARPVSASPAVTKEERPTIARRASSTGRKRK